MREVALYREIVALTCQQDARRRGRTVVQTYYIEWDHPLSLPRDCRESWCTTEVFTLHARHSCIYIYAMRLAMMMYHCAYRCLLMSIPVYMCNWYRRSERERRRWTWSRSLKITQPFDMMCTLCLAQVNAPTVDIALFFTDIDIYILVVYTFTYFFFYKLEENYFIRER